VILPQKAGGRVKPLFKSFQTKKNATDYAADFHVLYLLQNFDNRGLIKIALRIAHYAV